MTNPQFNLAETRARGIDVIVDYETELPDSWPLSVTMPRSRSVGAGFAVAGAQHRQDTSVAPLRDHTYNVLMNSLAFEWDERTARSNVKKHGISFEEARTVFYDEHAIQFSDPDHSDEEDRFILLGTSLKLRVRIVCHCFRESETVVRLISARKADGNEDQVYWRRRK